MIILYVDDLLVARSKREEVDSIKDEFKKQFKMKDLGEAKEFLGMEISRDRSECTLSLCQNKYTDKILDRFGMMDCKPCETPMEVSSSKVIVDASSTDSLIDSTLYRQAIGSLIYLMIGTRPDIANTLSILSQYCEKPYETCWKMVKRVFRYLKGTRELKIIYRKSKNNSLIGYSDSDWAGCHETRKSTEGFVFLLAGGAVSWHSKKQSIVALSSCDAEYIAISTSCKEAIWLSRIFSDMSNKRTDAIPRFGDTQGSIALAGKKLH